jgi:hypothetical protein
MKYEETVSHYVIPENLNNVAGTCTFQLYGGRYFHRSRYLDVLLRRLVHVLSGHENHLEVSE